MEEKKIKLKSKGEAESIYRKVREGGREEERRRGEEERKREKRGDIRGRGKGRQRKKLDE